MHDKYLKVRFVIHGLIRKSRSVILKTFCYCLCENVFADYILAVISRFQLSKTGIL